MSSGLKSLIANCILLGWNVAAFLFHLLDKRIGWAIFAACSVPLSIWGIHSSLNIMRAESCRYQLEWMRSFMDHITRNAPKGGEDNPN